ncbi:hypothetical protein RclHR1_02590010 [Rhizophagus clarus]|uniref:Uncharacterized protein n=1 Tax=Rhizophagus clarus TaxID=94130 RepID=A0A2Z6R146_9GLOM|nr:hypothetical protein RclHR1_02590010 [Rhizophagus clarus]
MDFASFWPITNPQSDFFEDAPIALYEFKTSGVGEYHYKIWDDSLRSRHFLGADHADGIEAILSEREDHSLHEFIDGDEPLHPFIDFNLPVKTLDAITSKLSEIQAKNLLCHFFRDVSLEIFSKWDKNTMTIADSSDEKKTFFHILTFGIRLPNITQAGVFTKHVCKKLPVELQGKDIIDNIAKKQSFFLRILRLPKYKKKQTNTFV